MKYVFEPSNIEFIVFTIEDIVTTSSNIETPPTKKIALLGMSESGKTQFLKTLQGEPYDKYKQSSDLSYEDFHIKLPSGKEMIIDSGIDLGGSDHYIFRYKKTIEGCDVVILVFDVFKFTKNEDYRLLTRSRFDLFSNGTDFMNSKVFIIGSHSDNFKNDEMRTKAQNLVYEQLREAYPDINSENFTMIDMRNKEQVFNYCEKILL